MPKLSVHVMGGGERLPMLHDDQGLPLFYPTLFATSQLRNSGAAVNTIRNKLADIVVLLRWQQQQRRDLVAEFANGHFLSLADVVSLRDFAKLDMRNQAPIASKADVPSLTVLDFLESKVASRRVEAAVGGQQHYNRLSTMADYLEFVAAAVTRQRNADPVAQAIERMVRTIRKHRPRGRTSRHDDAADRATRASAQRGH